MVWSLVLSFNKVYMTETNEVFDLSIPQQYLDAMAATDARITAQMEVWNGYIAELTNNTNTLKQLATQMNMLAEPLKRELESHQLLLSGATRH